MSNSSIIIERGRAMTEETVHPPIHPGEILLEEFMEPLGLSQNKLAEALDVDPGRINRIVTGKSRITADTALRLARYFGTTPQLWMNLQAKYTLRLLRTRKQKKSKKKFPFGQKEKSAFLHRSEATWLNRPRIVQHRFGHRIRCLFTIRAPEKIIPHIRRRCMARNPRLLFSRAYRTWAVMISMISAATADGNFHARTRRGQSKKIIAHGWNHPD